MIARRRQSGTVFGPCEACHIPPEVEVLVPCCAASLCSSCALSLALCPSCDEPLFIDPSSLPQPPKPDSEDEYEDKPWWERPRRQSTSSKQRKSIEKDPPEATSSNSNEFGDGGVLLASEKLVKACGAFLAQVAKEFGGNLHAPAACIDRAIKSTDLNAAPLHEVADLLDVFARFFEGATLGDAAKIARVLSATLREASTFGGVEQMAEMAKPEDRASFARNLCSSGPCSWDLNQALVQALKEPCLAIVRTGQLIDDVEASQLIGHYDSRTQFSWYLVEGSHSLHGDLVSLNEQQQR